MLKILYMISGYDGCGYYRVQMPAKYLNKNPNIHARITSEYSKENMEWPDIIVLQKQSNPKALSFVEHARSIGKIIITEVDDDYFNIPSWNPAHKYYKDKSQQLVDYYKRSDAITVTTPHLADLLSEYNKNTKVLPNFIDFSFKEKICNLPEDERFKHVRFMDVDHKKLSREEAIHKMNNRITIGWGGSPTHMHDLEQATDALIKICNENKNVLVIMMACSTDRILKEINRDQLMLVGPVPIFLYYHVLSCVKIDVGICPIEDNLFNRSKSNLKFLEFSSFGFPCVLSNVENYAKTVKDGEIGLLADNNTQSWYSCLKKLVDDPNLRKDISEKSYNFVKNNYSMENNYKIWEDFYTSLIGVKNG
jgi:processive 1,2-diacylglycerol beta-glucosyltransferase